MMDEKEEKKTDTKKSKGDEGKKEEKTKTDKGKGKDSPKR